MAKNNCYGIRKGYDFDKQQEVTNIIVYTWEECYKLIKGVKGANYKGFSDIKDANEYINQVKSVIRTEEEIPEDCMSIFVDGSFNSETEFYSYGFVVLKNGIVEYIESAKSEDKSKKELRQVAGELDATMKSVEYALSKNEKVVAIHFDYNGIACHCTGEWDRKDASSKLYYEKMQTYMKNGIEILFVKLESHTGEIWNEMADEKCKEELNIKSDGFVAKWLKDNKITVRNQETKNKILSLAPTMGSQIDVISSEKTCESESVDNINNIAIKNLEKYKKVEDLFKESQIQGLIHIQNLSETEKVDFILHLLNNK